ncbi:transporter substrate-binding domain-containing protein [Pseudoalteromonas sp. PS5]|uniref:transporter substrate-binding domain-containing protein n=1 Tax=Pseudoalteromonas sp. PS5 TaxID=1437473 RepID=UPI001F4F639A|nr:transporter substrate-binding domain-containing protein [Pseudoalteromonas sp. PS5]
MEIGGYQSYLDYYLIKVEEVALISFVKVGYFCTCLCTLLAVVSGRVASSEEHINFAIQYYPPFIIEHGAEQGLIIDVFKLFAAQYRYKINYLLYPERRSSVEIEKGTVEVRMESELWYRGITPMCWSEPLYVIEDVIVTHKQAEQFDMTDVKSHLFLGRFGYTYPQLEPYLEHDQLQRKDYYSEHDVLSVLAGGGHKAIAFTIIGKPTLRWYQLQHAHFDEKLVIQGISDVAPLQLQFGYSQKAKTLCNDFNHFLTDFKKTEQFKKILLKYGLKGQ